MKTYRTICRLDYPVCYSILDRLGSLAEHMGKEVSHEQFKDWKVEVDPISREIRTATSIDEDKLRYHLSLKTFLLDLHSRQGSELASLARHQGIALADDVISQLSEGGLSKFDRLGFRNWVLIADSKYTFKRLLDYFVRKNKGLDSAISSCLFSPTEDVGLVLESKNADNINLRVHTGPFQKSEAEKYFPFSSPIEEGLIIDIDLYEFKIDVPGFKMQSFVKDCQKTANSIAEQIDKRIREEIDHAV